MAYTPDVTKDIREQINDALEYMIINGLPIAITPEIHIGDVHLLNIANAKVNPATEDKQDDQIAAAGTTVDVPLTPDAETPEGATARTHTSLLKRVVNKLIDIKALLIKGTAIMTSALAVTIATDDTVLGPNDAVAVDGDTAGSHSAKLRGINKVLATLLDAAGASEANGAKAKSTVHTTKGDGQEIAGATAFDAGALLEIVGNDTPVWFGDTEAIAEANNNVVMAGDRFVHRLPVGNDTIWIDAGTGSTHSVRQVGDPL